MRKLQRQIKRAFLDKIKPGDKPKDTRRGMAMIAEYGGFKKWREYLKKAGREWRVKHSC